MRIRTKPERTTEAWERQTNNFQTQSLFNIYKLRTYEPNKLEISMCVESSLRNDSFRLLDAPVSPSQANKTMKYSFYDGFLFFFSSLFFPILIKGRPPPLKMNYINPLKPISLISEAVTS